MPIAALLGPVRFESPGYLALLAVLPLLVVLSIRSLAGLGRIRRVIAIVARCVVVLCMIFALAGAQRTKTQDALTTIFLIDRSDSIPRSYQQEAFEFVKQADLGMRPDDRIGVVAFDGRAAVEQLPMGALALGGLAEPVDPHQTDISAALRLAMALFPPDTSRRVVLLSDGNENVGRALEEAQHYRGAGVPIDIVPIQYEHTNEIVFEQLRSPPNAAVDETVNLQMVLRTQQAVSGRIRLYHNGEPVRMEDDGRVQLEPGANRFPVPVPLRVAGAHRFRAVFEPDDPTLDVVAANNEGQAFTIVAGQGKVLILTTERDMAQANPSAMILKRALDSERIVSHVEVAGAEPLDQVRLLDTAAVILSNVPANELSEAEQRALATYVRDLGGGLVMIGGDEAFGAGGWLGSPVEEVMPVSFDVKNMKQIPKGALCLVMHACEIPQGNYIGQRCAVNAVKTLSSRDLVGVLSYQFFGDDRGYWVVPLQTVGDKGAVIQQILKMEMGDMPDLDEVMRPAVEAMIKRDDAATRHIIVISDFDPSPPRDDLIKIMQEHKITCSTIGIGYGGHQIDERRATEIAQMTGGRFYATDDFSKLPQIFIKESRIVQRALINDNPFTPRLVNRLPQTVAGLTAGEIPPLGGYVVTTPKPLAEVPLVRPSEEAQDPVLAHWQVGLGKTVAFTSGMWSSWGADWAGWVQFSKFWGQLVRWVSRPDESAGLDVSTSVQDGKGRIRIDALDKNASAVDFMQIRGLLVAPAGPRGMGEMTAPPAMPIQLTQTGPGRYEGEFDAREQGSYVMNLEYQLGAGSETVRGTLRTGVSVAYSPEYRQLRPDLALLEELRKVTDGRRLDRTEAAAVFDHTALVKAQARRSMWEDLVRWTLVLFLLDVAIRRIAISPIELARKARLLLAEMAGWGRPAAASAAVLTTLKGTRARLREQQPPAAIPRPADDADAEARRRARYEAEVEAGQAADDLAKALGGATQQDAPVVARPTGKKPATGEADYTARLLKAKRRARDDLDKDKQDG